MWRQKIKGFLKHRNISQEEFAYRIGITQGAISRILSGHLKPKLDTLETIAKEMDLHVSELLQDEYPELEVGEDAAKYKVAGHFAKDYLFEEQQAELLRRIGRQNKSQAKEIALLLELSKKLLK